jgi:hypothetical protein
MALNYYAFVNNYKLDIVRPAPYTESKSRRTVPLEIGTPKEITLAEYNEFSDDLITAHKLRDYRKRTYTLLMLPDIKLPIDALLEG